VRRGHGPSHRARDRPNRYVQRRRRDNTNAYKTRLAPAQAFQKPFPSRRRLGPLSRARVAPHPKPQPSRPWTARSAFAEFRVYLSFQPAGDTHAHTRDILTLRNLSLTQTDPEPHNLPVLYWTAH